jgi:nucleotide sugar dehydrogenase
MKETARLRRRILSREAAVSVVGGGYVGLNLGVACVQVGFSVGCVDVDPVRVKELSDGALTVAAVSERDFRSAFETGKLTFSSGADTISASDVVLICVPTPLRDSAPDLSHVERACADVAERLRPGHLVVLESTTYPGTTDQLVRSILERSGLVAGKDFLLAYSPERIDPGNEEYSLGNTPKIVGGITPEATGVTALFYEQIVEKVVVVSSCRSAELAKLLENTFRHVNVALVNEMAMLCHDMDIDVWEVIDAAATKPFGFMTFTPGPGVGGHCIPLDPSYLAWQVRRDAGRKFRILEEAQDINAQMPGYVSARIGDALNATGKAVKESKILVLGVTYKADVADLRESPALRVLATLHRRGASIGFHDPFVDEIDVGGTLVRRTELTRRAMAMADVVAILTPHSSYDFDWIAEHAALVFDATNAYGPERRANLVPL